MRRRITITDNYVFLLSGLLFLFFLIPILHMVVVSDSNVGLMRVLVQSGFSGMMLLGVWSLNQEKRFFRIGLVLGVLSIAFAVLEVFHQSLALYVGESVMVLLFCVISGFTAARHVFSGTRIDRNMLYGAMCVYLLMGLVWAIVYTTIFDFWPTSFNGMETPGSPAVFDDFLYFSFVTLTSLGYGDISPVAPLARTFAYLEVIAGQFYIAIMVAGLVGLYMKDRHGG